jgi:hypothetical protein
MGIQRVHATQCVINIHVPVINPVMCKRVNHRAAPATVDVMDLVVDAIKLATVIQLAHATQRVLKT